jgi:hypothetical protein
MTMRNFERGAFKAVVGGRQVWLIHLVANAAFLVAFFYWTQIPEETGLQFAFSCISGLLIAGIALWLHCATFDYFGVEGERNFKRSLHRSASRMFPFLIWAVVFGAVLWLITNLWDYDQQIGGWLRHLLPGLLRRRVSPRPVMAVVSGLIFFLCFFLWPLLFLPVGARVGDRGFRGFVSSRALHPIRSFRFWLIYAICFFLGAYLPFKLAWMTPSPSSLSSLSQQTWSMVLRLGLGYVLLVTAWLVLCATITHASGDEPGASAAAQRS